jgi:type II secretory pathway component PulM
MENPDGSQKRNLIMGGVVILFLVIAFIVFYTSNKKSIEIPAQSQLEEQQIVTNNTVNELVKKAPLSQKVEVNQQAKLSEIMKTGEVSDCTSLSDSRYLYVCQSFFKK